MRTPAQAFPPPSRLPAQESLPDIFTFLDGTTVEDQEDWQQRRAELHDLFRYYMYGCAPPSPALDVTVTTERKILDENCTLREVRIAFTDLPDAAPSIHLALFLPTNVDRVPLILGLNRGGNQQVIADPHVSISPAAQELGPKERGARTEFWCVESLLERGYGFGTFYCGDLDADQDDFSDGIHPYLDDKLTCDTGSEWGTIRTWAWSVERCMDYLMGADGVDAKHIAVIGHSRRGKTALLAGALDERISAVIPHQSGTGGCALSRNNDQETIADITSTFPHWFADCFHGFAGRPERLPFDQHALLALVAPRPVLGTEGARDYWANPGRALDTIQAAAPAWDMLGEAGMVGDGLIHEGEPINGTTVGSICQYRCETAHTLNIRYWNGILDFLDLHFR